MCLVASAIGNNLYCGAKQSMGNIQSRLVVYIQDTDVWKNRNRKRNIKNGKKERKGDDSDGRRGYLIYGLHPGLGCEQGSHLDGAG